MSSDKGKLNSDDEIVDAYLKQLDMDTPDLWDRIEAGLDERQQVEIIRDNNKVEQINRKSLEKTPMVSSPKRNDFKEKSKRRLVYIIPILTVAAILIAVILISPLIEDRRSINGDSDSVSEEIADFEEEVYEDVDVDSDEDLHESEVVESEPEDAYSDADESAPEDYESEDVQPESEEAYESDLDDLAESDSDSVSNEAAADSSDSAGDAVSSDSSTYMVMTENVTLRIVEAGEDIYICNVVNENGTSDSEEVKIVFENVDENLEAGKEVLVDILYYDENTSSWVARIK